MNVESATPLATGSGTLCDDERAAAAQRIAHRRHRAFWIYAGALGAAATASACLAGRRPSGVWMW